jgi:hypothetical protein
MTNFFLAVLTTALIVNTWINGSIFNPYKNRLLAYALQTGGNTFLKKLAFGPTCQYCLSHWVGFVVTYLMMNDWKVFLITVLPVIWLSNHSIIIYSLIATISKSLEVNTNIKMEELAIKKRAEMIEINSKHKIHTHG